jgi:hypothetical protein
MRSCKRDHLRISFPCRVHTRIPLCDRLQFGPVPGMRLPIRLREMVRTLSTASISGVSAVCIVPYQLWSQIRCTDV